MTVTNPPINDQTLLSTGRFTVPWIRWFQSVYRILNGQDPFILASYEVADLPNPVNFPNGLIYVSDATGGAIPAFSDGTDWRRVDTRTIVT
jgi:hypothetical protein